MRFLPSLDEILRRLRNNFSGVFPGLVGQPQRRRKGCGYKGRLFAGNSGIASRKA